jgi:hypothetical protein
MIELKTPSRILRKKMYNLILDNQAEEIKLLLYKMGLSIPNLYDAMKNLLKRNKIFISKSTFKNMLMESSSQRCDLKKRLEIINLIFEYLDPDEINALYESVKHERDKKIRSIMNLLKSDYKDKREYLPEEVLRHAIENLPKDMKNYWETWRDE